MPLQITISSDNIFSLGKDLAALSKQFETCVQPKNPQLELTPSEEKPVSKVEKATRKPRESKKLKSVAESIDQEESEPMAEEETSTIDVSEMKAAATSDVTEESVREALKNLIVTEGGPDKAKALINSFGAKKFSDLDPKKYGAVIAAINAAI